jgi:hypothetical protein
MIRRTVEQLSTQRFVELFPKFGYKLWSAVRHYCFWNPVQTENTSNIKFHVCGHCILYLDGKKVGNLCKPINYNPYRIKTFGCFGQSHNKIHANIPPFPSWNGQELQWSSGLHMYCLDTSTGVTSCHIACNLNLHFCPPIVLL